MYRVQRSLLFVLMVLIYSPYVWGAAAENITISTAVVGPTVGLCAIGGTQTGAMIQILDQPVWFTLHSPLAIPGPTVGGLASPGTFLNVRSASEFRAVRSGATDARAYIVCLPQ